MLDRTNNDNGIKILGKTVAEYLDGLSACVAKPETYSEAIKAAQKQINGELMESGVLMLDPDAVYVDFGVTIGKGTVIYPGAFIEGKTEIGENCEIGPNTRLSGMKVMDGVKISYSVAADSEIGKNCTVGPFAYIRPGSVIGEKVKVGDFVEVKNSTVGNGTKIAHLTYIGDADVGSGVNFGCGTVVVNYDGKSKFRTKIGSDVFVGCNSNLVSPVDIGDGAYIAAGSTITENVPENILSIARARQVNKEDWKDKRQ